MSQTSAGSSVHGVRRTTGVRGRGRGHCRGRGHGGSGRSDPVAVPYKSYDDPDVGNPPLAFTPSRLPGIHFGRPLLRNAMTKAVDFFYLFFTVDMINNICEHTNSYALEHIFEGHYQSYAKADGSWQDVTPDEIKRVIALLIYFGLVKVGIVEKYWSKKSLYHGLWSQAIMGRSRFKAIMAVLHVVDPATETPGEKLHKIESFVDYFKSRCLSLYQPRQNIAIDERMVKSRHRSGIRQYIRDKPTKWGIKLWVLADSSNGYTVDFDIYIGRAAGRDVSAHGRGYDVVMRLIQPFLRQGYHLFVDNFYSSVTLFKDLFAQGTAATGTIMETRKDFPASLKNSKRWARGKEKGAMRWERDPPCLALQWVDNKVVSLLTTIDNANGKVLANRRSRTNGVWRTKVVSQPKTISNYNKYMNGVDRSDQMLATNNVSRKSMKWWKTLFFHLIDIAVVNGFILFKEHQAKNPDNKALHRTAQYSQADFREEIVRQLCDLPEYDVPPVNTTVKRVPPPDEFDTVHIPEFSDARRNCVVCRKQRRVLLKVSTFCSAPQCRGKFMHLIKGRNCFKEFHSRKYMYHYP